MEKEYGSMGEHMIEFHDQHGQIKSLFAHDDQIIGLRSEIFIHQIRREHDYCYVLCQYAYQLTGLLENITRYSDARS